VIEAVTINDFIGFWKINSSPFQSEYLQDYLNQWQDKFIRYIISPDAFVEIDDDGFVKQKWVDLFEGVPVYFNNACNTKLYQEGVTKALKGLLYFVYVKDRMFDPTESGNVEPLQEVSNRTNNVHNGMIAAIRWSNAISVLGEQILPFIDNYETITEPITSSVDNGGGSYTINVNSTFYLSNNETVTINGTEYTTSNLVIDTSFDISGAVIGLDFTGDNVVYHPYKDFPLCNSLMNQLRPVSI